MTARFLYRAICVDTLEASIPFYRDGLGFQPVGEPEVEQGAWLETLTGLPGAKRIHQRVRNGEGITLDLYAFQNPAPVGPRERRKNNQYGLTHLAFYVDSVDDWAGRVSGAGGKVFAHTRATFRDNGTTMMYCTDPDGTRVELMQAPGERQRFSHSGVCMDDIEHFLAFYRGLAGLERAENYEPFDHGYFMNVNHGLLNALGVSTAELEDMVTIARREGALGAKLTGSGGGGAIVALPPDDADATERIAAVLRKAGYRAFVDAIG